MKIAIPVVEGNLSMHFGHCQEFHIFEVDNENIVSAEVYQSPPHQPGLLPQWLKELGADIIIAGGMGRRAMDLFAQSGIEVVIGVASAAPKDIVEQFIEGRIVSGDNICDH